MLGTCTHDMVAVPCLLRVTGDESGAWGSASGPILSTESLPTSTQVRRGETATCYINILLLCC